MKFKELALEIAKQEGKKQSVNIAQINEILKITLRIFAEKIRENPFEFMKFLARY